jgi:hypothetical protein
MKYLSAFWLAIRLWEPRDWRIDFEKGDRWHVPWHTAWQIAAHLVYNRPHDAMPERIIGDGEEKDLLAPLALPGGLRKEWPE